MIFAITALAIALIAALIVLRPLVAAPQSTGGSDVDIYKAQLQEIDRDVARGVLTQPEAEATRLEVSRRLLAADRSQTAQLTARRDLPLALSVGVLLLAGAGVGYWQLGAPGLRDAPRADRLAAGKAERAARQPQAQVEVPPAPSGPIAPEYQQMIERLREVTAERPDDLRGQRLLARHEANLSNFAAAARAQERVVTLLGADATADDRAALLDLWVFAADGYVSAEAAALARELFNQDDSQPAAMFHLGLLYEQTDRPDVAFRLWRDLIEAAPDTVHAQMARGGVAQAAMMTGLDYTPPALPGPNAAQIAAADDMTAQDRDQMIRGMVEGLNARLATDGGTAQEWARLISALGVLGETDRAAAIWGEAQARFAAAPDQLAVIRQAANRAGLE